MFDLQWSHLLDKFYGFNFQVLDHTNGYKLLSFSLENTQMEALFFSHSGTKFLPQSGSLLVGYIRIYIDKYQWDIKLNM